MHLPDICNHPNHQYLHIIRIINHHHFDIQLSNGSLPNCLFSEVKMAPDFEAYVQVNLKHTDTHTYITYISNQNNLMK